MDIKLVPLTVADREQFILDNQQAFKYGAQKEFGMRDDRMEEGEEVISRKTIERCLDDNQADYCFLLRNFSLLSGAPNKYLVEIQQDTPFLFLQCNYCNSITNLGKTRKKRLLL